MGFTTNSIYDRDLLSVSCAHLDAINQLSPARNLIHVHVVNINHNQVLYSVWIVHQVVMAMDLLLINASTVIQAHIKASSDRDNDSLKIPACPTVTTVGSGRTRPRVQAAVYPVRLGSIRTDPVKIPVQSVEQVRVH